MRFNVPFRSDKQFGTAASLSQQSHEQSPKVRVLQRMSANGQRIAQEIEPSNVDRFIRETLAEACRHCQRGRELVFERTSEKAQTEMDFLEDVDEKLEQKDDMIRALTHQIQELKRINADKILQAYNSFKTNPKNLSQSYDFDLKDMAIDGEEIKDMVDWHITLLKDKKQLRNELKKWFPDWQTRKYLSDDNRRSRPFVPYAQFKKKYEMKTNSKDNMRVQKTIINNETYQYTPMRDQNPQQPILNPTNRIQVYVTALRTNKVKHNSKIRELNDQIAFLSHQNNSLDALLVKADEDLEILSRNQANRKRLNAEYY